MNDTKNPINNPICDPLKIESKLHNLSILLVALNAYGSLSLNDYWLLADYIKGAFGYELPPVSTED